MKKKLFYLTLLILTSCGGTQSTILSTWKNDETSITSENFKKVLVVGLVKDENIRKRVETRLNEINPIFKTSYPFLNKKSNIEKDLLVNLLKSENFDGVVTMRLVDVKTETSYSPSTVSGYYYSPYGYSVGTYGGLFGNWYGSYSSLYYSPGYFVENTYYIIETNVFSLHSDKLIWSAVTKTAQFSDIEGGLDDILKTLENQMRKDGSLPPSK